MFLTRFWRNLTKKDSVERLNMKKTNFLLVLTVLGHFFSWIRIRIFPERIRIFGRSGSGKNYGSERMTVGSRYRYRLPLSVLAANPSSMDINEYQKYKTKTHQTNWPVGLFAQLCDGVSLFHLSHPPSSPLLLGTVHGGGQGADILHRGRLHQLGTELIHI